MNKYTIYKIGSHYRIGHPYHEDIPFDKLFLFEERNFTYHECLKWLKLLEDDGIHYVDRRFYNKKIDFCISPFKK